MTKSTKLLSTLIIIALFAISSFVIAGNEKKHKIVIQVSTNDIKTQTIAMNNAVNLQKHYGLDNEIVAAGVARIIELQEEGYAYVRP